MVAGLGVVAPGGIGAGPFQSALHSGRAFVGDVTGPLASAFAGWPTGQVGDLPVGGALTARASTWLLTAADRFALIALDEAWEAAGLGPAIEDPRRAGIYLGSCAGGTPPRDRSAGHGGFSTEQVMRQLADVLAHATGIEGPRVVVNTACASGAHAIGLAWDAIRAGVVDLAIAGGIDELSATIHAGFISVQGLDRQPCSPYGRSSGLNMGEGGALFVLEADDHARERGVTPAVEVLGYGSSADAYHPMAPDPTGAGAELAVRRALDLLGLDPSDIDYLNGHGTATPPNDAMEAALVARLAPGRPIPISSTKAMTGHALGGSAAIEAAATMLAIEAQLAPPTAAPAEGDERLDVIRGEPRQLRIQTAVSTSYAFGGNNVAVVLGVPRESPASSVLEPAAPCISAVGAVGPLGPSAAAWSDVLMGNVPGSTIRAAWGSSPEIDGTRYGAGREWRRLDEIARWSVAAVHDALEHRDGPDLRGDDDVAVLVSTESGSLNTAMAFQEAVERSSRGPSPAMFGNVVMNSTAGHLCTHFGWRGPTSTLISGWTGGANALQQAGHLLQRGAARAVVVVGTDLGGLLAERLVPDEVWRDCRTASGGFEGSAIALIVEPALVAARAGGPPRLLLAGSAIVGSSAGPPNPLPTQREPWAAAHRAAMEAEATPALVIDTSAVSAIQRVGRAAVRDAFGAVPVSAPGRLTGGLRGAEVALGVLTAFAAVQSARVPAPTAGCSGVLGRGDIVISSASPGATYASVRLRRT